jgi:hypothetical protein
MKPSHPFASYAIGGSFVVVMAVIGAFYLRRN